MMRVNNCIKNKTYKVLDGKLVWSIMICLKDSGRGGTPDSVATAVNEPIATV